MQVRNWLPFLLASLLVASCFLPWVTIASKNVTISGVYSDVVNFGRPALFNFFITALCLILLIPGKGWSYVIAFSLSMFNIAWAFRNYFLISGCRRGICPEKRPGLHLLVISTFLFSLSILFLLPRDKRGKEIKEIKEVD